MLFELSVALKINTIWKHLNRKYAIRLKQTSAKQNEF